MNELMKDVISRAKCYECGGTMEGRKGEYKYIECGLTSGNSERYIDLSMH